METCIRSAYDADLTMRTHVQRTVSRWFATLRQLRTIRRSVPLPVFQLLVVALVLSRLDYCNSLLINLLASLIQRPQSVQNAAARLIFNMRRSEHITDALINLHWLRVLERIIFKVATLTFRALHGTALPYMTSQFTRVADMPNRCRLLSASSNQLDVPSFRLPTVGSCAFPIAGLAARRRQLTRRCHLRSVPVNLPAPFEDILIPLLLQHSLILLICYTLCTKKVTPKFKSL